MPEGISIKLRARRYSSSKARARYRGRQHIAPQPLMRGFAFSRIQKLINRINSAAHSSKSNGQPLWCEQILEADTQDKLCSPLLLNP